VSELRQKGLHNPLGIARLCAMLESELLEAGCRVEVSSDFHLLNKIKQEVRGDRIGPMHDADVCDFSGERAFWLRLVDENENTVGIQAYRIDNIDTSLADWLPNYMIGVYMRRREIMMPSHPNPPRGSISWNLRGRLVYEGELWQSRTLKPKTVFDKFARLGLLLCAIKWDPDAHWGLAGEKMARYGHVGRMGYSVLERGFLRWEWASKDIDPVEYLAVLERDGLEQMVEEMLITTEECRLERLHTPL
jgi:hypothetical protein